MTTVAKKVETFEAALVPVGELETVAINDFLEAYPVLAKPIPEDRLREILDVPLGKKDLPKLWLIYRGYSYLEKREHVSRWQKEKEVLVWNIETTVLRELKNPENQNPEDAKLLYDSSPNHSKTREQAEVFLKVELEKLFDEKTSSVDLKSKRKYFPKEFEVLTGKFAVLIRKRVVEELKVLKKPEKIFECIDTDDAGISEVDWVAALNGVIDRSNDVAVIAEALERIPNRYEIGPSVNKSIIEKGWKKIIRLTNDKELLFGVKSEYATALAKIYGILGPASLEELKRADVHIDHWQSMRHQHEPYNNVLNLMEVTYMSILTSCDKQVAEEIMESFKNGKDGSLKHRVFLQSIRRLYELSQSK